MGLDAGRCRVAGPPRRRGAVRLNTGRCRVPGPRRRRGAVGLNTGRCQVAGPRTRRGAVGLDASRWPVAGHGRGGGPWQQTPAGGGSQTTETVSFEMRPGRAAECGRAIPGGRTSGGGEAPPATRETPPTHRCGTYSTQLVRLRTSRRTKPRTRAPLQGRPRLGKPVPDHPRRPARVLPVAASAQRNARHAPVAQGIEQRPPEPCAQVRILPGAPWIRCPKTPSPAETLRPGSSRMCRRMRPGAAVCRRLWTIRGQDLETSAQVSPGKRQGPGQVQGPDVRFIGGAPP